MIAVVLNVPSVLTLPLWWRLVSRPFIRNPSLRRYPP